MKISATYKGSSVNIVDVEVNGSNIYVTYVNGSGDLISDQVYLSAGSAWATSATILSGGY
jgi:hypothetical protein